MTKHANTRPFDFDAAKVARRKSNGAVRYQDPRTLRMSGWVRPATKPTVLTEDELLAWGKPALQKFAGDHGLKFNSKTNKAALVADILRFRG